ncbi:hypothetical protein PF008_g26746 [Phytophthora fragariae]|uniref:Uncharacterized protein n=1 Tax=Phytophthora fragariae TaxID=53985 RepID=A0A6G0QGR9_9STRA|nr:hypothetical protein PF008_g26746 [Phytophthora fragariae]
MCVVVPGLLVAPYANAMDTANSSFRDPDQLYDPVFITQLLLEFQLTFASGLTDFTAYPHSSPAHDIWQHLGGRPLDAAALQLQQREASRFWVVVSRSRDQPEPRDCDSCVAFG